MSSMAPCAWAVAAIMRSAVRERCVRPEPLDHLGQQPEAGGDSIIEGQPDPVRLLGDGADRELELGSYGSVWRRSGRWCPRRPWSGSFPGVRHPVGVPLLFELAGPLWVSVERVPEPERLAGWYPAVSIAQRFMTTASRCTICRPGSSSSISGR